MKKTFIKLVTVSVFFAQIFFVYSFNNINIASAASDTVYLNYSDATAGAQILDVYQEIGGAATAGAGEKWARWRLKQYSGGNGAWEVTNPSYGSSQTTVLETTRANFSYVDGSGDTGTFITWSDYAIGNIVAKRRDSHSGYVPYSAYASYTATSDYDNVYLGIHKNAAVNGVIRVKINDVISTTGSSLDSNGEYDEAAHGTDNVDVAWIHIGSNISNGDVIKIEAKGETLNDRHVITGLRFTNSNSANPGDPSWSYAESKLLTNTGSSQSIAVLGHVDGQSDTFMFGVAHINHEYNASLSIDIDGTTYTLGDNLTVGQTVSGNLLTVNESSTSYGNTQTTDDFGTLNRIFTWQNNEHTQSWDLDFSRDFTVVTAYASMWPSDNSSLKVFRYADMGSNFVALLPNGVTTGSDEYASVGASATNVFQGGTANLKLTFETTAPVTSNFLWMVDNSYHKDYFRIGSWEKTWHSGETMGGHTTTFTLDYQTPESISWSGKTLYIGKPATINNSIDFIPFNGKGIVVKTRANGTTGLTFSGLSPTKTFFTSGNDDSTGATEDWNSNGTPQKGNWAGVTISGTATSSYNIFSYASTGLTISSNANANNNSFHQNTTGINAASGSIVRNNALNNVTTNTTGTGDFDYNCFSGNTETHGISGDPLFVNAATGDLSLQSTSPCIDAGADLGATYSNAINPASTWPSSVITIDQSLRGTDWEIGAYIYPVPQAPTIGSPTAQSASSIRWNFTDNANDETGFRIYDNTDTLATSSTTANLTYLDETGLSENTQYAGRYATAYNSYGNSASSSAATVIYTLADTPTNLSASSNSNSVTLSVDSFPNDASGQSGYYFSRSGANSGWIQTNSWTDSGLSCGNEYTYSVKYRNGDGTETSEISTTKSTSGCGGGGSPAIWTLPTVPTGGFKISINGGVATTTNRNVILNFNAGADIKKMAISMTGDFTDASQEDYTPIKQWDLCSKLGGAIKNQTCPDGTYTVYTKFYTVYGRSSVAASVSNTITLKSTTTATENLQQPINNLPSSSLFTKYLQYRQTNPDIKRLQIFLNSDPDTKLADSGVGSSGHETNYFGVLTYKAVIKFQEKYAKDVLAPWGFVKGTGYVGKTTLAKINELISK